MIQKIMIKLSIIVALIVCTLLIVLNPSYNKIVAIPAIFIILIILVQSFLKLKKHKKNSSNNIVDTFGLCLIYFFLTIYLYFFIIYLISGINLSG